MKRLLSLMLISLVLASCNPSDSSKLEGVTSKTKTPQQAVEFTLPDLAGNPHRLSEYLEKGPVMLVYFTTWCPYCKKAIPTLKQVYREYGSKGLQLVAINAGLADSLENAQRYALQHRLPYAVLYDADGNTADHYGVSAVPIIFYIQKDGRITHTSRHVSQQAIEHLLRTQG